MKLKYSYLTKEEIPAGYEALYTEAGGKWVLTGVEGLKTPEDVATLQESLRKERNDHKETKGKLAKFGEMDADELVTKLDRLEELEATGGKVDDEKIDELVEKRIVTRLRPLERERDKLKGEKEGLETQVSDFQAADRRRTIQDAVRGACKKAKVIDHAVADAEMLGEAQLEVQEDGSVTTKDGIDVDIWLTDVKQNRPHWWAPSQGGGAGGGNGGQGGENPWSKGNWNRTAQAAYVQQHGMDKAKQMAAQAGSAVGAVTPPAQ
ncbi:hypothetical protein pD_gene0071 [Vibrio phage 033B]|nr:hypothetical protein pD_gene0071 [Vibrio phage 033B]